MKHFNVFPTKLVPRKYLIFSRQDKEIRYLLIVNLKQHCHYLEILGLRACETREKNEKALDR